MTPVALLADLQARGVRLYLAGDELRYKAKAGTMPPDLAASRGIWFAASAVAN